ncbi:hypothetical protein F4823DRAFT_110282 [Ustulina deusta]|nr:hypothetical protein F4823DRAFT_110282 [Ustulina deusta]
MMASHAVPENQSPCLLNKKYDEDHSFPHFALLPWELRNQVWRCALQKRRLIRVSLSERQPEGITEQESRDIRYGRCSLFVDGFQLFSKLLRVSAEARAAALKFYRVRLPSVLTTHPGTQHARTRVGIFPFNPEYDVLWFERVYHLADFFSAVAMHDSRRVGLCNAAISLTDIEGTLLADDPDSYMCPAFTQTIRNMREFYLVTETSSYHLEFMKEQYNDQVSRDDTRMTQSLSPLMSSIPSFEILHRDPRSIESDLSRLFLGFDDIPSELFRWKALSSEWGVDHSRVESRVLFVFRDENPCLPAEHWSHEGPDLQRSRIPGTDRLLHESSSSARAPAIHLTVERQPRNTGERPAFGFWLFPLDAFTQANRSRSPVRTLDIWNLSDHWPELGLIHLPAGPSSK